MKRPGLTSRSEVPVACSGIRTRSGCGEDSYPGSLTPGTDHVMVAGATADLAKGHGSADGGGNARSRGEQAGAEAGRPAAPEHRALRRMWPDLAGLLFVVAAAVAVLLPALLHGGSLGPFDLLSRYGVSKQSGVTVHNAQTTDLIAQMIPWTSLAWTQVHHGQLPLWNPYNGLGMPLAFNWQSATFGGADPARLSRPPPLRLHGPGRGHAAAGRNRDVRPRTGAAAGSDGDASWPASSTS